MLPISLLALQKVQDLLANGDVLSQTINTMSAESGLRIPTIRTSNILISSASAEMGDRNAQLTYPRACLSVSAVQNAHLEKFRSFSGNVTVLAEILASGNRVADADQWIHYYVEAMTGILRKGAGDWGDGVFFGGMYDCQILAPKPGGLGFAQAAKVSFDLQVSRD